MDSRDRALANSLIALADANRRTLGFLPERAIRERVDSDRALIAAKGDELAGYALFDLPRDDIRLIHLCVAPTHRGEGVARSLVEALAAEHASRRGIVVRCRRDWPANGMWPALGFAPRRDVPGRGKDRKPLTVWWLDFGLPDLFSGSEDIDRLVVAMDTNVFIDLHSELARSGGHESETLRAPWIEAEIELVVTPALINELDRTDDPALREKLVRAANGYRLLRAKPDETGTYAARLLSNITASDLKADPSLPDDARLVAASGIGGADAYITRDASAIEALSWSAADQLGIQLLRPSDLAIHLDKVRDTSRLAERRLHESRVTIRPWPVGSAKQLAGMINNEAGETRADFDSRVRGIAGRASSSTSRLLLDDDGLPAAAIAIEGDGPDVDIPFVRVLKGQALSKAVAGQVPLLLRREAITRGAKRIVVTDDHCQRLVIEALLADGFAPNADGRLMVSPIAQVLTMSELLQLEGGCGLAEEPHTTDWARLEHVHWPLKIRDANALCYMVPIKPAFASRLFGMDLSLLDRDPQLALAREHIYYRAPSPRLSAPSRILWYVSSPDMEVIGCSQAVSTHVDRPEVLHERFRHLGVWDLQTIAASAKKSLAGAVRFRGTELFPRRVPLATLRRLAPNGELLPLQSPRRISQVDFLSVYAEGQRRS